MFRTMMYKEAQAQAQDIRTEKVRLMSLFRMAQAQAQDIRTEKHTSVSPYHRWKWICTSLARLSTNFVSSSIRRVPARSPNFDEL